jgi:hypothetical protein
MSHGKIVVEESHGGSHGKRVVDGCPRSSHGCSHDGTAK